MKAIIIDASRAALAASRRLLASADPLVEVTEYDAEQLGPPPPGFNWGLYDLLLIAQRPGDGRSALDWLERLFQEATFPVAYVLTADKEKRYAARARVRGARGLLAPQELTVPRLRRIIRALDGQQRDDAARASLTLDAAILQGIAALGPLPGRDGAGYRFQRLIGQGAFSRVYLAEQAGTRELTVLKLVDLDQDAHPEVLVAFIREASLLAATTSPHVARYFAHGCTRQYAWLAMEFLGGGDLKQRIEAGLDTAQAVRFMRQLLQALQAVHRQGIVHCDLKPGNLLFRRADELVLVDFGLSRQLQATHDEPVWLHAHGTAGYCSPEQLRGETLNCRTDLYSAGVVFFEMLTGRKPYIALTPKKALALHLHAPLPQLPQRLAAFQPVLERLLAKLPAERFDSATATLDALSAIAGAAQSGA